jgi:hypothetical protein
MSLSLMDAREGPESKTSECNKVSKR